MDPLSWSGAQCHNQRNLSLEAFMNLKLSIAALFLAIAIPAAAQTVTTTPAGCEGAASGTVLADGTLCTGAGTGTGTTTGAGTGTGTLGTNITPLMGGDDDSDGDNEGAEHQNSATHTENNGTDHDSAGGNDDNGSDHDNDSDNGDDD
jgi:hypothetical protein